MPKILPSDNWKYLLNRFKMYKRTYVFILMNYVLSTYSNNYNAALSRPCWAQVLCHMTCVKEM